VPPTHHFHHVRHTIDGIDLGIAVLWCQQRLLAMSLASDREVALMVCTSMVPGAFQVVECFPPQLEQELLLALAGEPVCWSYDAAPVGGTDFQRRVWQQLERVEVGETISYGQLATRVGVPGAARAVGSACGKNRLPLRLPCHRIISADGQLGGFTGDLKVKALLLEREAAAPVASKPLPT